MSISSNISALKRATKGSSARAPIANSLEEFGNSDGTFTNRRAFGTTPAYQRGFIVETDKQFEIKTGGIKEILSPGGARSFEYRYSLTGQIREVIGALSYVISGKTTHIEGKATIGIYQGSYIDVEVDVPAVDEQVALVIESGTLIGRRGTA